MKKRWSGNDFNSPSPSVRSTTRSFYTHSSRSVKTADHSVFDRLAGSETYASSSTKHTDRRRPSSAPRRTSNAFFERLAATETFASAMMKGLISQEELNLRSPERERDSSTGRSVRSASSAKSARSARSVRTSMTNSSFFDRMSKAQTFSSASKKGKASERSPRYGGLPLSPTPQSRPATSTLERVYKSETSKLSRQNKNVMSASSYSPSSRSPRADSSRYSQSHSPTYAQSYTNRPSSAHSSSSKRILTQARVSPSARQNIDAGRPRSAAKSFQRPPSVNTSRLSPSPRPRKAVLSPPVDSSLQIKQSHVSSPAVAESKKSLTSEVKPTPREALVFESDDELSFGDESDVSLSNRKDQPQDAGKDLEKSNISGLSTSFAAASFTNEEDYGEKEGDAYSDTNHDENSDSYDELDEVLADTYDQEEPMLPTESNDDSKQEYANTEDDVHEDHVSGSGTFEKQEEDKSHHSEEIEQDPAEPGGISDDGLSVGSDASNDEWIPSTSKDINDQKESHNEEQNDQNGVQYDEVEDEESEFIQDKNITTAGVENVDSLDLIMADTSVDGDEETAYEDHSYATESKNEPAEEPSEMMNEEDDQLPTYRLLKSEKYHPEYGFEVQDTDELYLTETLQAWEQGEISNHEIAVLIIEAFFERDFENGEHWEVDAGTARELEEDEGGGPDLEGRAFVVKRQARLDWNDLYSVAAAKGTIIIYPEKKEVRVENYSYFVAG